LSGLFSFIPFLTQELSGTFLIDSFSPFNPLSGILLPAKDFQERFLSIVFRPLSGILLPAKDFQNPFLIDSFSPFNPLSGILLPAKDFQERFLPIVFHPSIL
jgi:hypothetical protein